MQKILLFFTVFSLAVSAEVYKTKDKDGNVIYSDNPPNESAKVAKLPTLTTVPSDTVSPTTAAPTDDEHPAHYEVQIVSPKNEVVIPPGERDLAVVVSVEPSLFSEHLLVYYLDEELIEETQSTNIVITDPPRGGRKLTVEVIDQTGEVLGISEPIMVNVIKPIVKRN